MTQIPINGLALILLFALLNAGVATANDSTAIPPEVVPLVRLIALPDQYSGKEVMTFGLLKMGFKEDVLYMSRDDAEHEIIPNGLNLEFPSRASREAASKYSGKVVMIRGRFAPAPDAFGRVAAGILLGISEVVSAEEWQE